MEELRMEEWGGGGQRIKERKEGRNKNRKKVRKSQGVYRSRKTLEITIFGRGSQSS